MKSLFVLIFVFNLISFGYCQNEKKINISQNGLETSLKINPVPDKKGCYLGIIYFKNNTSGEISIFPLSDIYIKNEITGEKYPIWVDSVIPRGFSIQPYSELIPKEKVYFCGLKGELLDSNLKLNYESISFKFIWKNNNIDIQANINLKGNLTSGSVSIKNKTAHKIIISPNEIFLENQSEKYFIQLGATASARRTIEANSVLTEKINFNEFKYDQEFSNLSLNYVSED